MKPTLPTIGPARHSDESRLFGNHPNNAPIIDWSFQPNTPEIRGGGPASFPHPAFHTLSDEFFAVEAKKESRLEGAVFALIVALAVWPMALAAQAAFALMK